MVSIFLEELDWNFYRNTDSPCVSYDDVCLRDIFNFTNEFDIQTMSFAWREKEGTTLCTVPHCATCVAAMSGGDRVD